MCHRLNTEKQKKSNIWGIFEQKWTPSQKWIVRKVLVLRKERNAILFWAFLESPRSPAESHTITSTCSCLRESMGKALDGLTWLSPPCLGANVASIAGGNGGPLRRQQGSLSALEMSPWEMITFLWKLFVATSFSHNAFWQINQWCRILQTLCCLLVMHSSYFYHWLCF